MTKGLKTTIQKALFCEQEVRVVIDTNRCGVLRTGFLLSNKKKVLFHCKIFLDFDCYEIPLGNRIQEKDGGVASYCWGFYGEATQGHHIEVAGGFLRMSLVFDVKATGQGAGGTFFCCCIHRVHPANFRPFHCLHAIELQFLLNNEQKQTEHFLDFRDCKGLQNTDKKRRLHSCFSIRLGIRFGIFQTV